MGYGRFGLIAVALAAVLGVAVAQTPAPTPPQTPPAEQDASQREGATGGASESGAEDSEASGTDASDPGPEETEVVEDPAADPAAGAAAAAAVEAVSVSEPPAPTAQITDPQLIDVPNDDGTQLGVLWHWQGDAAGAAPLVEVQPGSELLADYELDEAERNRLSQASEELAGRLAELLPERDRLAAAAQAAQGELAAAGGKDPALEKAYFAAKVAADEAQKRVSVLTDRFQSRVGRLAEKQQQYDYLAAALSGSPEGYVPGAIGGGGLKGEFTDLFGDDTDEADKNLLIVTGLSLPQPASITDSLLPGGYDALGRTPPPTLTLPLEPGRMYVLRMAATPGGGFTELGGMEPRTSWLRGTLANNIVIAILYALVILVAINVARRSPDKLFIRRIAGLEAVDEAIGRATEMGKPVLYLPGMDPLEQLPTLAAINILGRVARRVADFDSNLLVPCRDPVVMTVAQEVVKAGYADAGRPDAYREDNIYFVTNDQFSYVATTCGIMLREKPAANFFLGYYYAESLLLAETGASTGAIQIAGTDSVSQLPFFITTCDYTLIGEELYAASAYLSREPLLLGSLKGQDLAKAAMMLLLIAQTLLFLANPEWDFLKRLVTPL